MSCFHKYLPNSVLLWSTGPVFMRSLSLYLSQWRTSSPLGQNWAIVVLLAPNSASTPQNNNTNAEKALKPLPVLLLWIVRSTVVIVRDVVAKKMSEDFRGFRKGFFSLVDLGGGPVLMVDWWIKFKDHFILCLQNYLSHHKSHLIVVVVDCGVWILDEVPILKFSEISIEFCYFKNFFSH